MIPVTPKGEPAGFDANVRKRGQAFLAQVPTPTAKQFKDNAHWKWAAKELYEAYERVCAYSCVYLPTPPGTIDHFIPKSRRSAQAYEWSNFRLAQHRMNLYKADSEEVIDPFLVQLGWFVLDFPSCLMKPGEGLSDVDRERVEKTIKVLRFNDDDSLVQERCEIMMAFADAQVGLPFLRKRWPFLAVEIVRHGIQTTAHEIFKRPN